MLSISKKAYYGIAAIFELTEHSGKKLVQIKDIAQKRDIPKNYLEQLLNRLLKSGIIKSTRGSRGGYELACPPEELSLITVLEALEGRIELGRNWEGSGPVGHILQEAENALREVLGIDFAELLKRQQSLKAEPLYFI